MCRMIQKLFNHKRRLVSIDRLRLAFIDQVPYIGETITMHIYTDVGEDFPKNIRIKSTRIEDGYVIINERYKCKPIK